MNKLFALFFITVFGVACAGRADTGTSPDAYYIPPPQALAGDAGYDAVKGEGRFSNVIISPKLNSAKAAAGENVYLGKCTSCHKLSNEKLIGPGLKEVTLKRHPAWILNFIANTDAMLNKDPLAKRQLEICMVRMPNLNLSDDEILNVYEFMRRNDGVQ